ncbi:MAG: hemerythrin domain-containing protein [Alphaproteobacteria bacterium]
MFTVFLRSRPYAASGGDFLPIRVRFVAMTLDYDTAENHVGRRDGLPAAIRPSLLPISRDAWRDHPRFRGHARFLMHIHRQLLGGAGHLNQGFEELMETPDGELKDALDQSSLVGSADHLIRFAHAHHAIEDHEFFPQIALLYPKLATALALLDGDHRILEAALDSTDSALQDMTADAVTHDRIAALHEGARALDKILNRHIWDEEEIVIPVLLEHG